MERAGGVAYETRLQPSGATAETPKFSGVSLRLLPCRRGKRGGGGDCYTTSLTAYTVQYVMVEWNGSVARNVAVRQGVRRLWSRLDKDQTGTKRTQDGTTVLLEFCMRLNR